MTRLASHSLSALLIALTLAACGSDESAPEEGHTPADAALFVGGVDVSAGLVLPAGETVRVEVRFLDDARRRRSPGSRTTTTRRSPSPRRHWPPRRAWTARTSRRTSPPRRIRPPEPFTVGYGHDEDADELDVRALRRDRRGDGQRPAEPDGWKEEYAATGPADLTSDRPHRA